MVKNCGDLIHFKVAEKNIPREMVKIIKKRVSYIPLQRNEKKILQIKHIIITC